MNKDKIYKEAIADWRRKHFKEMETNITIAIDIRDDTDQKAKDRIDAIKTISRMLGTLAPEKIEKREVAQKKETPFSKSEKKELDARLKATLGDQWIESGDAI